MQRESKIFLAMFWVSRESVVTIKINLVYVKNEM